MKFFRGIVIGVVIGFVISGLILILVTGEKEKTLTLVPRPTKGQADNAFFAGRNSKNYRR